MILYTQDEVEKYARLLARAYDVIRDQIDDRYAPHPILREIERTMGWNVPPPMNAKPPIRDDRFDVGPSGNQL